MLPDPSSVLFSRTQRLLLIASAAWGLHVLLYLAMHAPLCAINCGSQTVSALLLYAASRAHPSEARRRAIIHGVMLSSSLGMVINALLCGAEHSATIPYLSFLPLFAALQLDARAALLWAVIDSALLWVILLAGPHMPTEVIFKGPSLIVSQMSVVFLVAVVVVTYDQVNATYVRAVEQAQADLRLARDAAIDSAAALREILDNVTFGFFVLGPDLRVQPQFTRSCVQLFHAEDLAGRRVRELLPELSQEAATMFDLQMEQVFADMLPTELCFAQAQQRFVAFGRALRLEGRALRTDSGAVKGILFTVSDITDLELSQEQARHHKLLVDLLQHRESFLPFVRESFAMLDRAADQLAQGDEPACRLLLHTFKGNAGAHGLLDLMSTVHDIESRPALTTADVAQAQAALRGFLQRNRDVLEIDPDDTAREISEVSHEQLGELAALVARLPPAQQPPLRAWARRAQARPARIFLGPVEPLVQRIAARSGKQVRLLQTGLDTLVDPRRMGGVLHALQHMVRNAVDHGIEPPEERRGKPPCGVLALDLRDTAEGCVVTVSDDGQGIDTERLVTRALAVGLLTPEAARRLSEAEALELIFWAGLSTAEQVTEISGRGVGLSACRAAVEEVGGRLTVESVRGQGTRMRITVPTPPE